MLLLGLSLFSYAQENDSLLVPIDSVAFDVPVVDSIEVIFSGNDVQNATAIRTFFEKLYPAPAAAFPATQLLEVT